jgi:hypothetical protein
MSMKPWAALFLLVTVCCALLPRDLHGQAGSSANPSSPAAESPNATSALKMTKAVACRSIDGYEQYEPLPGGALTSEEKLQIYYRPLNYKIVEVGNEFMLHFTQDGQIRRKGEKGVLRRKKNILDYEGKSPQPPGWIYLRNSVPLKGLPPGEYEYDIILRDENNPAPPVTQAVSFRIIPPGIRSSTKAPEN